MRMERREHHRVRLRLPARIRWATPFGQRTEVQETLDVSRGGLLLSSHGAAEPGAHVWVTFPYDSSIPDGQPEVPARVVRAESPNGGALRFGIRFDVRPVQSRNGNNGASAAAERRSSPRRPLAVPVRVRLESLPWFEEAMTFDASLEGLRFLSTREYDLGARLMISFGSSSPSPWLGRGDFLTIVVRTEPEPSGTALAVSVRRL